MTHKKNIYTLLISIFLCISRLSAENFIFDLGGVLIDTDPVASLRQIGLKNLAHCMIAFKKGPSAINKHIKSKFFEILENVATDHSYTISTQDHYAYDEQGNTLPALMCLWLAGTIKSDDIRTLALNAIEQSPDWFDHTAERQAIENLIAMVFTPEHFIASRKLYSNSINFIKSCKKQGHKVYILSNWDTESFELLQTKYPHLFDLFDGIVISGDSNAVKPSPNIYTTLLNRYNLDPQKCWFIDDQQENVTAACTIGINGILCTHKGPIKKPNFKLIAQQIKEYNSQVGNAPREAPASNWSPHNKETNLQIGNTSREA
jgi:HAD superfamily hydrolase (TIGR01509 family)